MNHFFISFVLIFFSTSQAFAARKVSKGVDKDIHMVIQRNMNKFIECYVEKYPKNNGGSVTFAVIVNGMGQATTVRLIEYKMPTKSARFVKCLKDVISDLDFPISGAYSRSFTQPFHFGIGRSR
ncbi:MAG: hypothetical protein HRU09_20955 [Oligoflexales bacterium]|nr:hypothetical protein [Oligoflexales bacterium]